MQLSPGNLFTRLRDHRVTLNGTRAVFPGKVDCCTGKRVGDAALSKPRTSDETSHCPYTIVGFVLHTVRPDERFFCKRM